MKTKEQSGKAVPMAGLNLDFSTSPVVYDFIQSSNFVQGVMGPEAAAMASAINYLQVNVLFEPLTPEQLREQRQRLEELVDQQRREQSGLSQPSPR